MDLRVKISNGAIQLFSKYGIRSITMDMIADHLGMSKRTIYENFKDKDELLRYCIESIVTDQKEKVRDLINQSENIIDATFKFVKFGIHFYESFNPLFFLDIQKYHTELCDSKIRLNQNQNIERTKELLNKGITENLFRKDIHVEIVSILLSEQFRMLNDNDIFPNDKFSKVDIFENIVVNFIRGIATEKGLLLINEFSK